MKLLRHGSKGYEKPAVVHADGTLRDLRALHPDIDARLLSESGMPIPKEPIVFMKTVDCAVGCHHPIVLPQGSVKTDWEVELGVVIGSRARYVSRENALQHVHG